MDELDYDHDPSYDRGLVEQFATQHKGIITPEEFPQLWEYLGGPSASVAAEEIASQPEPELQPLPEPQPEPEEGVPPPAPEARVHTAPNVPESAPVEAGLTDENVDDGEEADEGDYAMVAVPVGIASGERLVLALSDGREVEADVRQPYISSILRSCWEGGRYCAQRFCFCSLMFAICFATSSYALIDVDVDRCCDLICGVRLARCRPACGRGMSSRCTSG